jgi:hypothetical protein
MTLLNTSKLCPEVLDHLEHLAIVQESRDKVSQSTSVTFGFGSDLLVFLGNEWQQRFERLDMNRWHSVNEGERKGRPLGAQILGEKPAASVEQGIPVDRHDLSRDLCLTSNEIW